ncbi:MAG: clostripain-related cysteine peptidase [Clostridium sp.]
MIKDIGNKKKAHPKKLYEFIKMGIQNYPSKHYMVILSGHGICFIGNMTDLTYDVPYMMGTPEMCKAIELINLNIGVKIDILVLDMCYMNSIEIIYEFGKNKDNAVENILTYIDEGPFKGLPYDTLISTVEKHSHTNDSKELIIEIMDNLDLDTVAFELDNQKLEKIKTKFNDLAYSYLNNHDKYEIDRSHLLNKNNIYYPWYEIINELNELLTSVIIHYKQDPNNHKSLIKVVTENIGDLIGLYYKLSFSKNNYWPNILSDNNPPKNPDHYLEFNLTPMKLSEHGILYSILTTNPTLTNEDAQSILNEIFSISK